jgi:hypothetical protein
MRWRGSSAASAATSPNGETDDEVLADPGRARSPGPPEMDGNYTREEMLDLIEEG